MKFSHALLLASTLAFFACGDDDDDDSPAAAKDTSSASQESSDSQDQSSDSAEKAEYDCTVSGGVKVVYPAGGETFHVGDTITVIYGSDLDDDGYRITYRKNENTMGIDLTEGSVGQIGQADGKTCYEETVVLEADNLEPSDSAFLRVMGYTQTSKGANSGTFTVLE